MAKEKAMDAYTPSDKEIFFGACLDCTTKHLQAAEEHLENVLVKSACNKDEETTKFTGECIAAIRAVRLAVFKYRVVKGGQYINP